MAESSNRQKDIFLEALELSSPEERAAYLLQECGDNAELRAQIEALLKASAAPDSFLEKPAAVMGLTIDELSSTMKPGTRIGKYKLLEEIGDGGMGVVYMAEQQEPVRRIVALKIIKPGMDSGQVLARFEAERQALAMMDHPNIAKVLDAGATADGRPFFVMELVKGTSITFFCDANKMSARQRLELFVPVCQAIQHAHQKGVIHRDIKPSNVLIALYDDKPVPKVIDFGVAKATGRALTERTLHTGFGAIVGTPEYMSPEQATFNQLDVDTRSDIYSLGVLLYELLTGSTPVDKTRFKEEAILEVLRVVREEEPPRPSLKLSTTAARASIAATRGTDSDKLEQLLRGELDWIVMKSLEKDRNRRYETAAGLARDVERYLKDELVEARPPSAAYRLRKFVNRNRGTVLAAALLLATLVAGVIGTTVGMLKAIDAGRAAELARDEANNSKRIADGHKDEALRLRELSERHLEEAGRQMDLAMASAQTEKAEAIRTNTARHAIQMDSILRAWQRDDLATATDVLEEVPESFRRTWEYRYLRDLCRRRAMPALAGYRRTHYDQILLSPDGKTAAALTPGSKNSWGRLKIMDPVSGQERWDLGLASDQYLTPCFSPDSKLVALFGITRLMPPDSKSQITIWNVATGAKQCTVACEAGAGGTSKGSFSPDGKFLAVPRYDNQTRNDPASLFDIVVVDTATGAEKYHITEAFIAWDMVYSPDGKLLAGVFHPNATTAVLKIYDAANGKEKTVISMMDDIYRLYAGSLSFSHDGQRVLAMIGLKQPGGKGVKVWNVETGAVTFVTKPVHAQAQNDFIGLRGAGFLADARSIVLVTGQHDVTVVEMASGKELPAIAPVGPTTCALLDAEGRRVKGRDLPTLLWSLGKTELATATLDATAYPAIWWYSPFRFTPDSKQICGAWDGAVTFWDARTGQKLRSSQCNMARAESFSSDSKLVACSLNDPGKQAVMVVFDTTSGHERLRMPGADRSSFSPDGKWVACQDSIKHLIVVFDTTSGAERLTIKDAYAAAFSHDGNRIAISTGAAIQIWSLQTWRMELSMPAQAFNWLAFSQAGQIVGQSKGVGLVLFDAATGAKIATIAEDIGEALLLFMPDGKRLLTTSTPDDRRSSEKEVKIWNMQTGQMQGRFRCEGSLAHFRMLSPDGTRLFWGHQVWDVATGQLVMTFPDDLSAMEISPDGRRILAKQRASNVEVGTKPSIRMLIFEAP